MKMLGVVPGQVHEEGFVDHDSERHNLGYTQGNLGSDSWQDLLRESFLHQQIRIEQLLESQEQRITAALGSIRRGFVPFRNKRPRDQSEIMRMSTVSTELGPGPATFPPSSDTKTQENKIEELEISQDEVSGEPRDVSNRWTHISSFSSNLVNKKSSRTDTDPIEELEGFRKKVAKGGFASLHKHQTIDELEVCENTLSHRIQRIVSSRKSELIVTAAIVINAILIGIQADIGMTASPDSFSDLFRAAENVFMFLFAAELVLRVIAEKPVHFFSPTNEMARWNMVDTVLVLLAVTDELVSLLLADSTMNMSAIRILRMMRVLRLFRIIRVLRFFKDLRVMAQGVVHSFCSLIWALLILFFIMYIFAVCILQFANVEKQQQEMEPQGGQLSEKDYRDLINLYSSMFTTIFTLYQAITGGLDWGDASSPLLALHTMLAILFAIYVAFAVLCVLNIITGVFVDNANRMVSRDEDLVLLEQLESRRDWFQEVKVLFEAADRDGSGKLNAAEFSQQLKDIHMQAWFRKIGVHVESYSAENLFHLLDFDNDGELDLNEFYLAVQRLHGQARSIDIAMLSHDMYNLREDLCALMDFVVPCFEVLCPDVCIDFQKGGA